MPATRKTRKTTRKTSARTIRATRTTRARGRARQGIFSGYSPDAAYIADGRQASGWPSRPDGSMFNAPWNVGRLTGDPWSVGALTTPAPAAAAAAAAAPATGTAAQRSVRTAMQRVIREMM